PRCGQEHHLQGGLQQVVLLLVGLGLAGPVVGGDEFGEDVAGEGGCGFEVVVVDGEGEGPALLGEVACRGRGGGRGVGWGCEEVCHAGDGRHPTRMIIPVVRGRRGAPCSGGRWASCRGGSRAGRRRPGRRR